MVNGPSFLLMYGLCVIAVATGYYVFRFWVSVVMQMMCEPNYLKNWDFFVVCMI